MIGLLALSLPLILGVLITIGLSRRAGTLGASLLRFSLLKLLVLDAVVALFASFLVSIFIFNPASVFKDGGPTFQDHFDFAITNAVIMSFLVVPGTLLAYWQGRYVARGNSRYD